MRKAEIIAPAEMFDAKTWHGIYRALEPFGKGNAEPSLLVTDVKLTNKPFRTTDSTSIGVIRLREHPLFRPEFPVPDFLAVLREIFHA